MQEAEINIEQSLRVALGHHQAGRLKDAGEIYRQILAANPQQCDALRLMGMIARQEGRAEEAVGWIRRSVASDPNRAEGHHNLGDALRSAGKRDEAIGEYRKAIALQPGWAEAYGALGEALREQGKLEEALEAFRKVVQINPSMAAGYLALGKTYHAQGERGKALAALATAIQLRPNSVDAHYWLGNVLWDEDRTADAISAYKKALEINPAFVSAYWNIGKIYMRQGKLEDAVVYFRRAAEMNPTNAKAHFFLGHILKKAERLAEAEVEFREAMRLKPDTPDWKFRLSALSGDGLTTTTPPQHVRELFDEYAAKFDKHLVEKLNYRGPQQLLDAVRAVTARQGMDVLDLGCGTGLCGVAIRPLARRLVGVDLSPAMLAEARRRGIYDELINGELVQAMGGIKEQFDLIIAGDVLIYVGDLSGFMPAAAGLLRSGGLMACSVEEYDGTGFFLHSEERFAHSLVYMRDMGAQCGLSEVAATKVALRRNASVDVPGWVVVMGKGNSV
jgi:predicted TPR repeat methyltransferase